MTRKKPEPKPLLVERMKESWGDRPELSGSRNGYVSCLAVNQVLNALWHSSKEDEDSKEIRDMAALRRVAEIGPRDVIEGMLAAQMVATHDAAMECFRRAHLPEQSFEGRQASLGFANKLVRSYAALVETLDKHCGKGQQVVRVEHVTVQAGGQAIVGAVTQGGGGGTKGEDQPHAPRAVTHEQAPRCGARTRSGNPCRSPMVKGKRRCRMHGGAKGSGAPKGNRNACKHGLYGREMLELRRAMRALLEEARELVEAV